MRVHERLLELAHPQNAMLLCRIVGIDLLITVILQFVQPRAILPYLSLGNNKNKKKTVDRNYVEKIVKYTDYLIWRKIPFLKGACLKRSLILYYFLRKAGVQVVVNIGITKEDDDLIGHSWLTLDEVPYYENREHVDRFNIVLRYPDKSRV